MRLKIKKPDLLFALETAIGVCETRTTVPILKNVKLGASHGFLGITATDMDMQVEIDQPTAHLETAGETTVPAKTLHDIVRKANADVIDLHTDDTRLYIRAGAAKFTLGTIPATDFPSFHALADETAITFEMPAAGFKRLIDRTKHAISAEETRYYLGGIYLHASPTGQNILRGVATNGHTLALSDEPLSADTHTDVHDSIPAVILPRKAANALSAMLATLDGNIKITMTGHGIAVEMGNLLTLKTKVIDGTYPDYTRVIPKNNTVCAIINNPLTVQAIDRAATVCDGKTRAVRLTFTPAGTLKITATGTDNKAEDETECQLDADVDFDIGFNSELLMSALKQLPETVHLYMADAAAPVVLHDPDDASHQYVVMPMRI